MNAPAIRIENLGKRYRLGSGSSLGVSTLGDWLSSLLRGRTNNRAEGGPARAVWALRNVSLEIPRGQVLGLIGANGAGKSTLLRILARISQPSEGHVEIRGSVGSLLEVGTGFHAELTGRENVLLSGAVLGMSRAEIARKFDDIVEFSGVEPFIDTPVKRYSTGMYLRLAFAVASHLEPEILLVDEVLAVGDLQFQNKCLSRIRGLRDSGATIILVSHSMLAVQTVCERVVLLQKGQIVHDGSPTNAIENYKKLMTEEEEPYSGTQGGKRQNVAVESVELFGEDGALKRDFRFGETIRVRIGIRADEELQSPFINIGIRRADGVVATNFGNWYDGFDLGSVKGHCVLEGWLGPLRLIPESYELHATIFETGGPHFEGKITNSVPLAGGRFGSIFVYGIGLVPADGVFQLPAHRWVLTAQDRALESGPIDGQSIWRAFSQPGP